MWAENTIQLVRSYFLILLSVLLDKSNFSDGDYYFYTNLHLMLSVVSKENK